MLGKKKKRKCEPFLNRWASCLSVQSTGAIKLMCLGKMCTTYLFLGGFYALLATCQKKEANLCKGIVWFFSHQALPPNPGIIRFWLKWYLTGWCLSVVNYCRPKGVFRNLFMFPLDLSPSMTYSLMIFSIIHYNHFFRITSPEWLWGFGKPSAIKPGILHWFGVYP